MLTFFAPPVHLITPPTFGHLQKTPFLTSKTPPIALPRIPPHRPVISLSAGKGRVDPRDEAFVTCPSCGSDSPISASRLVQKRSLTVRCTQCKHRFEADVASAMTLTGASLSDMIDTIPDHESSPLTAVKLYVGGLSSKVDSPTLKATFEEFGEVVKANVVYDHVTGRTKGFGFVTIANKSAASAAIDIMNDGTSKLGSRLRVREAHD